MARIIFVILLFVRLRGKTTIGNSEIEIDRGGFKDFQETKISESNYSIDILLDSKVDKTKIVFLSSTYVIYNFTSNEDKIIHLMILDLKNPNNILFNGFLQFSSYIPISASSNTFYLAKIVCINPLIIYINMGII